MQHTEPPGISIIPGANRITVKIQVNDKRTSPEGFSANWNRAQVGHQTNGLGEPVAPMIVVTEPIELTFKKAMESELMLRGFHIGDDAGIKIEVNVKRFYNKFKAPLYEFIAEDSVADLSMEINVKSRAGVEHYYRQIDTQGKLSFVISPSGEDAKVALDRALDSGLNILFSDQKFISALM